MGLGRGGDGGDNGGLKDDIYLQRRSSQQSQVQEVQEVQEVRGMEQQIQTPIATSAVVSLYSPKSCPICLEEYKVDDDIVWSKNDQCPHAFHLDCILDWLMDHDQCPLCRGEYLISS